MLANIICGLLECGLEIGAELFFEACGSVGNYANANSPFRYFDCSKLKPKFQLYQRTSQLLDKR